MSDLSRRCRILRICPDVPYPPNDGGRIESYNTTRELAGSGHSVTMIAFQWGDNSNGNLAPLLDFCELYAVPFRGRNTVFSLIRGAVEGFPVNYVKYRNQQFLRECLQLLRSRHFDLAIVDFSAMGWYALKIKEHISIPVVTRWQNVDMLVWRRWAFAQSNPLRRALALWQARIVSAFERRLALASDLCLTIAPQDTRLLQDLAPGAQIRFVPAGVDISHYVPYPTSAIEQGSLLFLASGYRWHANLDAARWLSHDIMPLVWRSMPDTKLYYSGKEPPSEMHRWAESERIILTGFVPDERDLLARANVVVIPMRLGGGIKIKVITSLAMGKALVSTPQGVEGVAGVVDGQHALIRETPEELAEAVIEVLRNPTLCFQLGTNGRELVQSVYDWRIIGAQWDEHIRAAIDGGTKRYNKFGN